MKIRVAAEPDHDPIWKIFRAVVASGDTFAIDPDISREEALAYWFGADTQTYVAESAGRVVGTYILRPNQSGGGSHVANAAFMVAPDARGRGVGRAMGEHCLSEARRLDFRAMQFNFVVATNESAVRLWQDLGFKIVGTLAGAFRHPEKDYIDVYVMYRPLLEDQA
jgi:L-amino acid N-acyltransferase YncA